MVLLEMTSGIHASGNWKLEEICGQGKFLSKYWKKATTYSAFFLFGRWIKGIRTFKVSAINKDVTVVLTCECFAILVWCHGILGLGRTLHLPLCKTGIPYTMFLLWGPAFGTVLSKVYYFYYDGRSRRRQDQDTSAQGKSRREKEIFHLNTL